jgi:predicted MFS family arabinose efflux permease
LGAAAPVLSGPLPLFGPLERLIIVLIGAVECISILEFMILMPLGPDIAKALAIDPSKLGLIGSSYATAAAVSGLVAALFLDRFDRRAALTVALSGLALATAAGASAHDLQSLMAARMLAGVFGGPAAAIGLAIIADYFPPMLRGRAVGAVMGGFTLASVVGVPLGLKLAAWGGWRLPLYCIGLLSAAVIALVTWKLPPVRAHLRRPRQAVLTQFGALLRRPAVLLSLISVMLSVGGSYAIIPNISAYLQFNHGYPRPHLELLYLVGGIVSFVMMQLAGYLTDRFGPAIVVACGALLLTLALLAGFVFNTFYLPILFVFVIFMSAQGVRNVAVNALTSRVPEPHERASFQSAQSAVQSCAMALGGFVSTLLLHQLPDHKLEGMPRVALLALSLALIAPVCLAVLQRMVVRTEAVESPLPVPLPAPDAAAEGPPMFDGEAEPQPAPSEI